MARPHTAAAAVLVAGIVLVPLGMWLYAQAASVDRGGQVAHANRLLTEVAPPVPGARRLVSSAVLVEKRRYHRRQREQAGGDDPRSAAVPPAAHGTRSRAMKKPLVRWTCGSVSKNSGRLGCRNCGHSSASAASGSRPEASTTASFSSALSVQTL